MMNKWILALVAVGVWCGGAVFAAESPAGDVPLRAPAAQIVELLKTRYVDRDELSPDMLSAASLKGILEALGQGAVILSEVSAAADAEANRNGDALAAPPAMARAEVIEPQIGYIRYSTIDQAAVAGLDEQLAVFAAAKVTGYILDLRFAGGKDYQAAAEIAGRFLRQGQDLFVLKRANQPAETFRAVAGAGGPTAGASLVESPLLLLVNNRTRGSAEALAGGLRAQDRGILIGGLTAGSAAAWEDVPLDDGRVLRIATAKILLQPSATSDLTTRDLFPHGLAPDVFVAAPLSVEQDVLFNAATNVALTVSLQPAPIKKRLSEADLVRAHRGEALPPLGLPGAAPTETPDDADEAADADEALGVSDVVLQRAVDVLKGIRVLLTWK